MMPLVLVVESDVPFSGEVRAHLENARFRVRQAFDAGQALGDVPQVRPDVILSEWALPDLSGIEMCARIRRTPETAAIPLIMMTDRTAQHDKVRALDGGVDDYVTKPVGMLELSARIRAVLRRSVPRRAPHVFTFEDIVLDVPARRVWRGGHEIHLPATMFRLLHFLLAHPDRVHSRDDLLASIWGPGIHIEPRTIDVHVRRLRQALNAHGGRDIVRTVRQGGYGLDRGYPGAATPPALAAE